MAKSYSPLRYPGGKSCLYNLIIEFLQLNKGERREYAEPYAGGCGLALGLLFGGHVSDIHINDIDSAIWSFWDSVLNRTEEFCSLIEDATVSVEEWRRQQAVNKEQDLTDPLRLGFSAFFLNRTNRSGIIKGAGVIGGLNQKGNYKIDCRFNKITLVARIRRIAKYRDRIHLSKLDALDFIGSASEQIGEEAFLCIDPPYFHKGPGLYTNFYVEDDHRELAEAVAKIKNPWVVTYDNCPEIEKLYKHFRLFPFDLNYSVQTKRIGSELLIPSKGLRVPQSLRNGEAVI
jgi:DNA adenine methylase